MAAITIIVFEAPDAAADLTIIGGAPDQALGADHTTVDGTDIHVIRYDAYPATGYCTEPEEYLDFPATARALAELLEPVNPGAAEGCRNDATRFETLWADIIANQ